MNGKKWTFSGIKRFFPKLEFAEWLKICARKDHYRADKFDVVNAVKW